MANETERTEGDASGVVREPYEPPSVVSEEVFETLALACGKADASCVFKPGGISS